MAKYNNRFIAIDHETGGLPGVGSNKNKLATIDVALTEVALVTINNESLEIISKHSWLVKPYDDNLIYDKGAEKASGINKGMCEEDGIDIKEVYENVVEIFEKNKLGKHKPILVMQNKSFDTPFIENLFKIFGDDVYKYIERIEDTLHWARYKWIEKPKFNLGSIAEYCGIDLVQAHRALPDTLVTAEIWISFMKNLRGENVKSEIKEEVKFRENFKF